MGTWAGGLACRPEHTGPGDSLPSVTLALLKPDALQGRAVAAACAAAVAAACAAACAAAGPVAEIGAHVAFLASASGDDFSGCRFVLR